MNVNLINRMRKARSFQVEVSGYKLTVIRPQEGDAALIKDMSSVEMAIHYVIDWHGVTEADLVPSGSSDPVKFDKALWSEWCRDRHDFWTPINEAIGESIASHLEKREAATKN